MTPNRKNVQLSKEAISESLMTREGAQALVDMLTYEEKLMLYDFLKALEVQREKKEGAKTV